MVAEVLVTATSPIIGVYSAHATEIWSLYIANNAEISNLTVSDCKENAFEGNDYAITSHGFRAVNCITSYNKKVANETKRQNDILRDISPGFDSVALNVIRGYNPPSNPMIDGEIIEATINATYAQTVADWNAVRPDMTQMRTAFANNLAAYATSLNTCFTNAKNYMIDMSNMLKNQVLECIEYSGSRRDQFIQELKKTYIEKALSYDDEVIED